MNTQNARGRKLAPPTVALALVLLAGCATGPLPAQRGRPGADAAARRIEQNYGIHVNGLHLSAHGYILDLRYRVRDAGKAALLLDPNKRVQLIDAARHARLGVPESPVIGAMRQTARNHVVYTDRDYFILFVNPGRAVRAGETLQLAVDGEKIADLTVE